MRPVRALRGLIVVGVLAAVAARGVAQERAKTWPRESAPKPLPSKPLKFPPYAVRTLENGLQVIAVSHHELPIISLRLLIKAGAADDPPDRPGVATFAAGLLDQGTSSRTARQIADTIDSIGGTLGAGAGTDLSYTTALVMKDSLDLGLDLLADITRNPAFAPEEIERNRQQILSTLQVSFTSPDFIAGAVLDRAVLGAHPYAHPNDGTPRSIAAITRDDFVQFHRTRFVPNNAMLAVVGDIGPEEAFAAAERYFGNWPRADVPALAFPKVPEPQRRIIVVDKPDAVQTEIRVGQIGIPRKDHDYMPLRVLFQVLGGTGSSRLFKVLRSERGLTYDASARVDALKYAGEFSAQTNTRSEKTAEALRLVLDEIRRLQNDLIPEDELRNAKAFLTGGFPLSIETPDGIATQVLDALFYDLGPGYLESFRDRINAVTADDIQRAAQGYLRPDSMDIVLVGNAAAFGKDVARFGKVEHIPIAELSLDGVELRQKPAVPAPASGSAAAPSASRGRALGVLAAAARAKGGLDALRAVKDVKAVATTMLTTPQGPVTAEAQAYVIYPDKFRNEVKLPMGTLIQVFNGTAAWISGPQGTQTLPPPLVKIFKAGAKRDLIYLLTHAADEGTLLEALDPVKTPVGVLDPVKVTDRDGDVVTVYVEEKSGQVAKLTYKSTTPAGTAADAEEQFSDYRTVQGIQVPFHAVQIQNGLKTTERVLKSVTHNSGVDPDLFKQP